MISSEHFYTLTVDVEDWFHIIGMGLDHQFIPPVPTSADWSKFPSRIEKNVHYILDLLNKHNVKGTFFILGWVAEHYPEIVRRIYKDGHEIACHGYWHKMINHQTIDEFREDIHRSVGVLENITGTKILGHRASAASITEWAFDVLLQAGFLYDSSYYPATYHDNYGKLTGMDPNLPIEKLKNGLIEVKMSSLRLGNMFFPWSGGGFFRLYPYSVFRLGVKQIIKKQNVFNLYIHPWEVDDHPLQLNNLRWIYKLRRYIFIKKNRRKFEKYISEFTGQPIITILNKLEFVSSN